MGEEMEIVREAWKAWAGDDLAAALAPLHDDVAWHRSGDEPEIETLRGPAAVAAMWREWMDSFDDFRVEPIEFIDAGDRVVVPFRISGRLPGSGAKVGIEETHVYRLRDGKVIEVREFRSKAEALAEAGFREG